MSRAFPRPMFAWRGLMCLGSLFCVPALARAQTSTNSGAAGESDGSSVFSLQQSMPKSPSLAGRYLQEDEGGAGEAFSDPQILWPGFLYGMSGFEKMPLPVSQPFYFEDPFIPPISASSICITTSLRAAHCVAGTCKPSRCRFAWR